MFNEIDWLKQYKMYGEFDLKRIESILLFSYIWNLFEREICEKNALIKNVSQYIELLNNIDSKTDDMDRLWKHFQSRYVSGGIATEKFNDFVFNDDCIKSIALTTLTNDNPSLKDKIETILRIVFRLRNNLFHGEKDVSKLYEQNELFSKANEFLSILLDLRKRY